MSDMNEKELIASCTNLHSGDVYVGFKNRDESFVKNGFYKMEGNDFEDLDAFIPRLCTCVHYAEDDVQEYCNNYF